MCIRDSHAGPRCRYQRQTGSWNRNQLFRRAPVLHQGSVQHQVRRRSQERHRTPCRRTRRPRSPCASKEEVGQAIVFCRLSKSAKRSCCLSKSAKRSCCLSKSAKRSCCLSKSAKRRCSSAKRPLLRIRQSQANQDPLPGIQLRLLLVEGRIIFAETRCPLYPALGRESS